MFHDSDFEFFQDLVQGCDPNVKEAVASNVHRDTQKTLAKLAHTCSPPQSWDYLDSNSSSTQGIYTSTSNYPVPVVNDQSVDFSGNFNTEIIDPLALIKENKSVFQVQPLSTPVLPEVINHSTSQTIKMQPPPTSVGWQTQDADLTKISDLSNSIPFNHQCSYRNMRNLSVVPTDLGFQTSISTSMVVRSVEKNQDKYEHIVNDNWQLQRPQVESETPIGLLESLGEHSFVDKMKIEECRPHNATWFLGGTFTMRNTENAPSCSYKPSTPKCVTECRDIKQSTSSRLHDSEDSETNYAALTLSKYKKRKHKIPIKDMIRELEGSPELTKVRRGRPPKRRESTSSCGLDLNLLTISTHENKYREFRDKNNLASKRSRLSRKYKELQMEQLSEDLVERNEKLRIRASMLEDAVKKLRETFLAAVSQRSQVGSNPVSLIRALYGDKGPEI